jgi:hypothetical protein
LECERRAAAVAALALNDTDAILAEVERHLARVHQILGEFADRRAGRRLNPPAP